MNCKFINVLMFAAGAAIGSAVTWGIVKKRYERIAQEEIDSVIERFGGNEPDVAQEESDDTTSSDDEEDQTECDGQIDWSELEDLDEDEDTAEYLRLAGKYNNEKGGAEIVAKAPYVIAPYDFGELDGYHQIELTYYADEVLEDDEYNIIKDADELLGPKALTTFGEYEDDAVFVRNEYLRTDFQVLKDYRTYSEARSVGPKQVDDE